MNTLLLLLGLLALGSTKRGEAMIKPVKPDFVRNRQIVRAEAMRQGVPVEIAMATARIESNFDQTREGDLNWHLNRARFERFVPETSPFRGTPELWHSYGLFQLLAPYHVKGDEDPRILLDPQINAQRGVATLRRLLLVHHGDPGLVRLHYTNADAADSATQTRVLAAWNKALDAERALL